MAKASILGQVRLFGELITENMADHPITEWIKKSSLQINLRGTRSLSLTESNQVVPLVVGPPSYWGEKDLSGKSPEFDEGKDRVGPLVVAAAIDTGSVADGGVKLKGVRIVAVGGGSFLINQMLDNVGLDFFLNSMNWMLEREDSIGIAPKVPQEFRVALEDKQLSMSYLLILGIPVLGALVGLMVWIRRRK
ncbi:MAG: hypothetical protein HC904_10280 [Blastochloris sp.]|nr:hypothetical protein [Blastochloris sp.]